MKKSMSNQIGHGLAASAIGILLTFAGRVGASVPSPTPPASHSMTELRTLLDRAVATHAREVVIPPGVYRGGPGKGGGAIITLRGAANLRIVARGVEMVCTMRTRALEFDDCRRCRG